MLHFFEEKDGSLIFRENGETVMVTPWGADSFRVRAAFLGEIEEGSIALLDPQGAETETQTAEGKNAAEQNNTGETEQDVKIEIHELDASITNGKIQALLTVNTWGNALQITFLNQKGEVLLQEIPNGGALQKKARHFKPLPGGGYRLKASFVSKTEEKIYGMGQYQQETFDLKGCNLELAHRNSQASVPFYLSSLGYGFLWHNAAVGEVHFGSNTTEWIAEDTNQLDYWITAGDTPAQIEEAYTAVTGRAPMMPEYGLGFWQCKLRYYNQEQVLQIAREYKKREIPVDVLVIDYYHWPRCGDWRFDEEYFPHPEEMIREIQEMGIKVMVSIWPQVDWRSENYEEMKQQGLLVKSNSGIDVQMIFHGNNVFMDATNPRTREYVWEKCRQNYADMGIRTFWLDEAEPEFTTYDYADYRFHAGPVAQIGNIYPREYARLFYEGQKACGQEDIVNLIRCAWVGSQRYGALVWSGDIMSTYEDFRKQICAGIHMGLCGIPWWTTDIGGFHGAETTDPEFRKLFVRWFAYACFCPVMRLHGNRNPQSGFEGDMISGIGLFGSGADNEVWSYGEEIFEICKKYMNIREQLRPYVREQMQLAHEKGTPVMRPLFYDFPEDAASWDVDDAYMFGPELLVAPVLWKDVETRQVYLPAGCRWTDCHTGKVLEGGQTVTAEAPADVIPVFRREGSELALKL